jgi:hypothetical protein
VTKFSGHPRLVSKFVCLPPHLPTLLSLSMAPNTRSTKRENTPPKHKYNTEWSTPQKVHFYDALSEKSSLRASAAASHVPFSTAQRWVQERKDYGSPANRRTRRMSKKLGRREKISPDQARMLVSPSKNPLRKQLYEAQIQYHSLPITTRTLQRSLLKHTKKARRYRMPYIDKELKDYHLQIESTMENDIWAKQLISFGDL